MIFIDDFSGICPWFSIATFGGKATTNPTHAACKDLWAERTSALPSEAAKEMESLGAANMEGIKLGFHRWGYNGYIYI